MTREELRTFVNTVERNIPLQEQLVLCKNSEDLILLAQKYGYGITTEDIKYDKTATKFESWFKESKINSLK